MTISMEYLFRGGYDMSKRYQCIHCLALGISWDKDDMPYTIAKETRERIDLLIEPSQEIRISHSDIEDIAGRVLPKGVIAKTLLPGRFLTPSHTHIIVEILKPVDSHADYTNYPPIIDMTGQMAIVNVSL